MMMVHCDQFRTKVTKTMFVSLEACFFPSPAITTWSNFLYYISIYMSGLKILPF